MRNLITDGFLFMGGGMLMNTDSFGSVIPFLSVVCTLIGIEMLIYFIFGDDGRYG